MSDPYDGPYDEVSEESIDALLDELSKKMGMPIDEAAMDAADNKANAHFWHDGGHIGAPSFEELKAQCFFCQKKLIPIHVYDVSSGAFEVHLECTFCKKKERVKLTQTQILEINKQGCWQAFLK